MRKCLGTEIKYDDDRGCDGHISHHRKRRQIVKTSYHREDKNGPEEKQRQDAFVRNPGKSAKLHHLHNILCHEDEINTAKAELSDEDEHINTTLDKRARHEFVYINIKYPTAGV